MRSYCYYPGNCAGLGLKSVFITLPSQKELEITKSQYTLQHSNPYYCEIMIQALPDAYMEDQNEIDIIVGQPLLFNYYTIFSVQEGKIGFYAADYTQEGRHFSIGAMACTILFVSIFMMGVAGCFRQYKRRINEPPSKVTVRPKSNKNLIK